MSDLFNPELYVSDVSVYYGSKCAVQNVSFNIHPGQLTALISEVLPQPLLPIIAVSCPGCMLKLTFWTAHLLP